MKKFITTIFNAATDLFVTIFKNNGKGVNIPTLYVSNNNEFGDYLTDTNGRALYSSNKDFVGTADSKPVSNSKDSSLVFWKVFYLDDIITSSPLRRRDFSTLNRPGGQNQLVYKGSPLYFYINDLEPGDVKGEGMNNNFFTIKIN